MHNVRTSFLTILLIIGLTVGEYDHTSGKISRIARERIRYHVISHHARPPKNMLSASSTKKKFEIHEN